MLLRWSVQPPDPRVTLTSRDTSLNLIVLKHGGRCGFGPEVWNVVLTMTRTTTTPLFPSPPLPSTRGLIQLSCCGRILGTVAISHGEEIIPHWSDQALARTGRAVREEMYTRCWKGAKERQGETEILQKTDTFTQNKKNQQLVLSYSPPNPLLFLPLLSALPASGSRAVCSAAKL